jgi:NAD+ synthase (glutamine-hydrolysing)
MHLVTLATCNLNQWALDFGGNLERVRESVRVAKARGARFRVGPELELCGYSCEDAFLEGDTLRHSWEALGELLADDLSDGILVDVGMPVMHRGVRYNCRVFLLGRRILLIRPKLALAQDGNYREARYFAAWQHPRCTEPHPLPGFIRELTGQSHVPIGDAAVEALDTVLASETCEELFTHR